MSNNMPPTQNRLAALGSDFTCDEKAIINAVLQHTEAFVKNHPTHFAKYPLAEGSYFPIDRDLLLPAAYTAYNDELRLTLAGLDGNGVAALVAVEERALVSARVLVVTAKEALVAALDYGTTGNIADAKLVLQVSRDLSILAWARTVVLHFKVCEEPILIAKAAEAARIKALAHQREAEAKANLAAASAREAIEEERAGAAHRTGAIFGVAFLLAIVISGALGLWMPALNLGVELLKVLLITEGEWRGLGALPLLFIVSGTFLTMRDNPGGQGFLGVMSFGIAMGVACLFIFVT
jgi:hypothetical protein